MLPGQLSIESDAARLLPQLLDQMMVLPQGGGAIPELVISIGSSVSLIILGVRFSKRVPHRIRGLRA
jgi:hypothetical protein